MPWDVKKRGSKWCVIKQGESTPVPGGCHPTKEKARAHQRALYASESYGGPMVLRASPDFLDLIQLVDRPRVYASTVSEGSDMDDTITDTPVTSLMMLPLYNSSGQTIGFVNGAAPVDTQDPSQTGEKPWSGILAIVGNPTSDHRYLIPNEIGNRDLPIPLRVQTVSADGHMGAESAGRIDHIDQIPLSQFDGEGYNLKGVRKDATIVFGSGMLDGSPAALEAERMIKNGAGISIDLPPDRMALIDPKTFEEVDPQEADIQDVLSGKYLTGIAGKIAAATIVDIPAFEQADIALEEDSVLVASAHGMNVEDPTDLLDPDARPLIASAAPLKPDPDWFQNPGLTKLTPLTITDEGRVFGHLADWDGCHTGFSNVCVPPFRSQTDYAYFNTGEIECEDGSMVAVGKLMFSMDGGKHASTTVDWQEASRHYDDSTKVGAFVRAGTDRFGTWLAGALRPGLSDEEVQHLRSHPPSGDWRPIPGKGTELVAAFAVAVGGFPIPRAMVASGSEGELTIISAPLDLAPGPHEVRRRMELARRRRRQQKADEDTSMAFEDPIWMSADEVEATEEFAPTAEQRRRWAKEGVARPDGSFPITKCTGPGTSAINARRAIGRANPSDRDAVKRHIAKRERALGCSNE